MQKVVHLIRGFDKKTEKVSQEINFINSIKNIQSIKRLFDTNNDPEMYNCYPVTGENISKIETILEIKLDTETNDYFVECDSLE